MTQFSLYLAGRITKLCIFLACIVSSVDQTAAVDFLKCGIDEYFQKGKTALNPPVSGILTHSVT